MPQVGKDAIDTIETAVEEPLEDADEVIAAILQFNYFFSNFFSHLVGICSRNWCLLSPYFPFSWLVGAFVSRSRKHSPRHYTPCFLGIQLNLHRADYQHAKIGIILEPQRPNLLRSKHRKIDNTTILPVMSERSLPPKRNYLMTEEIPPYSDLVGRRRLGQTQLTAKMVGNNDGVDESNLGVFDYAHLRAPLPKGIVSGIFKSSPSSYFLMRRSSDGYISATGMFKATFPYAQASEEEAERAFIKSLPTTSLEETAGNMWIPPEQAIDLAKEYGITPWVTALLDQADIVVSSTSDTAPKSIRAPPKFDRFKKVYEPAPAATLNGGPSLAPPAPSSLPRSTRSRRSASPTKVTRSPRKRSTRTSSRAPSETPVNAPVPTETHAEVKPRKLKRSEKVEQVIEEATGEVAPAEPVAPATPAAVPVAEQFNFKAPVESEIVDEDSKMTVSVSQDTLVEDGVETEHTEVAVQMPLTTGPPDAEETAKMIAMAKEQVEKATQDIADSAAKGKRKVDEVEVDDQDKKAGEGTVEPQAKRTKTDIELRKEQVKKRALFGITATLAVGALLPYVMGAL
ncbi:hypothetical protein MKZ38_005840 [Zalerion maritima]|uniref:HTH APSES-type domain-containing protein n=1 Tax=Zalerion maritima TaxID=339359 RepID=A0AAD5RKM6_9PEZI|nr:hypothetical protein MKZ38_005840 [Zalerion maritima]